MASEKQPKSAPKEKMSYDKAFARLQELVADMESENITVDRLSDRLKEAVGLLKICRAKLFDTEKEVQKILKEME